MITTPPYTPELTLNFLPAYWYSLITPCFSLLADDCQLSVVATKQATPLLLNSIYYQIAHLAQSPKNLNALFSMPCLTHPISGLNFQQMTVIRPYLANFHQTFFNNDKLFWLIIGVVAARTGISPQCLQRLADWLAFLALYSTIQCLNFTQTNINTFVQWLRYSLPDPKFLDMTLLECILVDSDTRTGLFFYPSHDLLTTNIKGVPAQDFFANHNSLLHAYQQSRPFGILPLAITDNKQHTEPTLTQLSQPILTKNSPLSSNNSFTIKTPTKAPWHTILQKHWMAFSAGLTALIIGGIGAVATNHKASSTIPTIDNKALAEIPHDVAIVRTDTHTTKTAVISHAKPKITEHSLHDKQLTDKGIKNSPLQKTKSDKSEKTVEKKRLTSHKKPPSNQTEKIPTDKKAKSSRSTSTKAIKKSINTYKDDKA